MHETQQRLTVIHMDDDDNANSAVKQPSHQAENTEELSSDECLMRRLALRGIHCATVPPREALLAHFLKHPEKFAPVLEWLRKDGDGLFGYADSNFILMLTNLCSLATICRLPVKKQCVGLNIDDGGV